DRRDVPDVAGGGEGDGVGANHLAPAEGGDVAGRAHLSVADGIVDVAGEADVGGRPAGVLDVDQGRVEDVLDVERDGDRLGPEEHLAVGVPVPIDGLDAVDDQVLVRLVQDR